MKHPVIVDGLILILAATAICFAGEQLPPSAQAAFDNPKIEKFSTIPGPAAVVEFKASGPQYIIINGKEGPLAEIAPDGSVKLYGKPNDAAHMFWQAVFQVFPQFCEKPHRLTDPSAYNATHGNTTQTPTGRVQRAKPLASPVNHGPTDTNRGNRPSAREGASGPPLHQEAAPTEVSGTDGIF